MRPLYSAEVHQARLTLSRTSSDPLSQTIADNVAHEVTDALRPI